MIAEALKKAVGLARAGFDERPNGAIIARRLEGYREVECDVGHPGARLWSLFGLMICAMDGLTPDERWSMWSIVEEMTPGGSLLEWSDGKTRFQVVSLLTRAYARAVRFPEELEPGALG